jgi:hypothetical protein
MCTLLVTINSFSMHKRDLKWLECILSTYREFGVWLSQRHIIFWHLADRGGGEGGGAGLHAGGRPRGFPSFGSDLVPSLFLPSSSTRHCSHWHMPFFRKTQKRCLISYSYEGRQLKVQRKDNSTQNHLNKIKLHWRTFWSSSSFDRWSSAWAWKKYWKGSKGKGHCKRHRHTGLWRPQKLLVAYNEI